MRDRVRCPFCPRTVADNEYREHFDRFHAVDLVSGVRRDYLPPKRAGAAQKEPRPRKPDTDEQATFPDQEPEQ